MTGAAALMGRNGPQRDEGLEPTLLAVGQKIGEFARGERALQRSPAYFRAIVENQCDIVALIGLDGRIHYENEAVTRVLGYERRERIGKVVYDFIHPEDVPAALAAFRKGLDDPGSLQTVRVRVRHRDGSWKRLESIGRVMRDISGTQVAVVNSREEISRPESAEEVRPESASLTERQLKVLALAAQGMTNKEIAEDLSVSPHTVKDNIETAAKKLHARNRTHAALEAARRGLI